MTVLTLHIYRPCATGRANNGADDRALAATSHRSNDCADRSSNTRTLDRLGRLVTTLRSPFIVNVDRVATWHPDARERSGEAISLSVLQPYGVKVERQTGSTGHTSSLVHAANRAFDYCTFVLTRFTHRH